MQYCKSLTTPVTRNHPIVSQTPPQITKTLSEQVSKYAQVVLDSAAYAGTGNVLKIQELLGLCGEHIETEEATAWKVGMAEGGCGRGRGGAC